MHTFMDAKLMAKLLRQALAERSIELSHSDCLELVARQFGVANWNILSAKIDDATTGYGPLPKGWIRSGKSPSFYRSGIDAVLGAAWLESRPEHAGSLREDDFCTIMQTVDATAYRGQRLQLSAQLKVEGASSGATIWFRIDGPTGSLRFENLERYEKGGPVTGRMDWTRRSIVLDVPEEATTLNFGFYLKASGKCWARGFALDQVDSTVPLNTPDGSALPRPTNLDFVQLA